MSHLPSHDAKTSGFKDMKKLDKVQVGTYRVLAGSTGLRSWSNIRWGAAQSD